MMNKPWPGSRYQTEWYHCIDPWLRSTFKQRIRWYRCFIRDIILKKSSDKFSDRCGREERERTWFETKYFIGKAISSKGCGWPMHIDDEYHRWRQTQVTGLWSYGRLEWSLIDSWSLELSFRRAIGEIYVHHNYAKSRIESNPDIWIRFEMGKLIFNPIRFDSNF